MEVSADSEDARDPVLDELFVLEIFLLETVTSLKSRLKEHVFEVEVCGRTTVEEVKALLHELYSFDTSHMHLVVNGKLLEDADSLAARDIGRDTKVYLCNVPRKLLQMRGVPTSDDSMNIRQVIRERSIGGRDVSGLLELLQRSGDSQRSGIGSDLLSSLLGVPFPSSEWQQRTASARASSGSDSGSGAGVAGAPPYASAVRELLQLGITQDEAACLRAIERTNGNVIAAENLLLEEFNSSASASSSSASSSGPVTTSTSSPGQQQPQQHGVASSRASTASEDPSAVRIKVFTMEDISAVENEFDLIPEKWTFPSTNVFEFPDTTSLEEAKALLFSTRGIPPAAQRWWLCGHRKNKTFRVLLCCDSDDEQGFEKLARKWRSRELTFFVELLPVDEETSEPIVSPIVLEHQKLVFLKHFDRDKKTLKVIGCQLVNEGDKISVFGNLLHSTLSVPVEDVEYFEEFRPNSIDPLAPDATFAHSQLGDGDIVIVQLRCEEDVPGVQAFCSEMRDTVFLKIRELGPDRSLMEEGNVVMMQVSRAITLPELRQLVLGKLGAQNSSSLQLFFQPEEGQPTNLRVLESLSDFFDYFSAETNVSVRGRHALMFYQLH